MNPVGSVGCVSVPEVCFSSLHVSYCLEQMLEKAEVWGAALNRTPRNKTCSDQATPADNGKPPPKQISGAMKGIAVKLRNNASSLKVTNNVGVAVSTALTSSCGFI